MKKILSIILLLAMTASMLSGCDLIAKLRLEDAGIIKSIPYELDQAMIDSYYAILEEAETLCIAGDDLTAAEEAVDRLDEVYLELFDQNQIAYILYCMDQTDEEMSQQYLYSTDVVTQAETDYNAMAKRVYLSDSPIRDQLFADWSQEEIDLMLAHNEQIAALDKRNTQITLEFRALDEQTWEADMIPLYNELVKNNNRIAQIYGYDNYYDFAYKMVYQRDYGQEQVQKLRSFVAQYLPDACVSASEAFQDSYEQLNSDDQKLISQLVYNPYDRLEENYVALFIADMPQTAQEQMSHMFSSERAVFTTYKNSYEGAFTTWIDSEPFCYFGVGYTDSETVIHELGHYYGSQYVAPWSQPMDISETQSQSNEWMYTSFLKKQLSPQVYNSLAEYKLITDIGNTVCFVMVDEFEERVYTHENAGNLTAEEYDAIMEDVAQAYGGIDYVSENMMDVQTYWKYVVLESPVYYISYAVSGIAAIDLFTIAEEDEEKAKSIYCRLMEEPIEDEGFQENIRHAGLTGPFEETVYLEICSRYTN